MTFLAAIWSRVSGWALAACAGFAALGAAWLKGRQAGKAALAEEQERHRAEARATKRKIDSETDARSDADLDRDLGRWVRR